MPCMNLLRRTTLAALLGLGTSLALPAGAATPPNLVILVGDDFGYSDIGAYGSEIRTPNLDALASSGVKFSNFHVAASCAPTRSMLMTGVDNHRNGMGNMPETMPTVHNGQPGYLGRLDDKVVTLASMFGDHGYRTYAVGKWHLGKTPDTLPGQRGFQRSFIQADSGSDNWQQRPYIFLYDQASWFENDQPANLPEDYYSSKFIIDKTIEYIDAEAQSGKPFLAYVGFQAVHVPVQAPREYSDHYQGRYQGGWNALREERRQRAAELGLVPADAAMVKMASTADWHALSAEERRLQERRMEVYAGMAENMDAHIGRLVAHLKQTGQYDNTVFVFLSDNGAEGTDPYAIGAANAWLQLNYEHDVERLGERGVFSIIGPSWASAAVSPLNTYKFWAGEGGLRVPLIVSGVPAMRQGQIAKGFAHVTDLMPTLLELAGIPAHAGHYAGRQVEPMTGTSLLPLLKGKVERAHPADQPIGYELSGNSALFKGDYKLLKNLAPIGDGEWHLYDIAKDPGETADLREQLPELFASLQQDFAAYAKANGVLPMPAGYDYRDQGQHYAMEHVLIPKLLAVAPWAGGSLAVLVALLLVWRRRRA